MRAALRTLLSAERGGESVNTWEDRPQGKSARPAPARADAVQDDEHEDRKSWRKESNHEGRRALSIYPYANATIAL